MTLAAQGWEKPEELETFRAQGRDNATYSAGPKLTAAYGSLDELLITIADVAGDMNAAGKTTAE